MRTNKLLSVSRNNVQFDLGQWHGEFLFLYGKYKDLREFCMDKDALYAHVTENRVVEGLNNGEHFKSSEKNELERWLEPKTEIIHEAFETFELQIPVILSSYLEDAIVTFFTCYLINNPNQIGSYVSPLDQDQIKGFVKFDEIIKHKSIEELVAELASKAAHNAASGKSKKKVFTRLEALAKYEIDSGVKQKIIALYEKRNEIVHENRKFELGQEYIEDIYDDCIALIAELGKICRERDIPYYDPSGLL